MNNVNIERIIRTIAKVVVDEVIKGISKDVKSKWLGTRYEKYVSSRVDWEDVEEHFDFIETDNSKGGYLDLWRDNNMCWIFRS